MNIIKIKLGKNEYALNYKGELFKVNSDGSIGKRKFYYSDHLWFTDDGEETESIWPIHSKVIKAIKQLEEMERNKPKEEKIPEKKVEPKIDEETENIKEQIEEKQQEQKINEVKEKRDIKKLKEDKEFIDRKDIKISKMKHLDYFIVNVQIGKKKFSAYVKPLPNNTWVVQQMKGSKLETLIGNFETSESAIKHFADTLYKQLEIKHLEETRKGGQFRGKQWNWKVGERIITQEYGKYLIGTIERVINDFILERIGKIVQSKILVRYDINPDALIEVDATGDHIVGRAVDTNNPKAIPPEQIHFWLKDDQEAKQTLKQDYDIVIDPKNFDTKLHDTCKQNLINLLDTIRTYVKDKYMGDAVLYYARTEKITINSMGSLGVYWEYSDGIAIRYNELLNVATFDEASKTLVHEVLHYRFVPVKSKLKKWLKDNILQILNIDKYPNPYDIKPEVVKKWLKMYFMPNKEIDSNQIRLWFRVWRNNFRIHDELYALTHFYETPSALLSVKAMGKKFEIQQSDILAKAIYKNFSTIITK